jgi:putative transposase
MVLYRRNLVTGGTVFFTVVLADRQSTRLTTHVDRLKSAFRKARAERPFVIDAIVVLPEHLHAIWTLPPGDADFAHRWRRMKGDVTQSLLRIGTVLAPRNDGTYAPWQRRFWEHTIRDDADYARHVDYIHYNPVKHGYVLSPTAWRHSSIHAFIRKGIIADDWGGHDSPDISAGEP